MKLDSLLTATTALAIAALIAPVMATADTPGRHPAYLRARTDLRSAQSLMRVREEPNITRNLRDADRETEAAIAEIDHAAVIDRKNVEDHPSVDMLPDRTGRFRSIVELLRSARANLAREEDNGRAVGWRDAAYQHIDAALEHMRRAAADLRIDRDLGF